MQSGIIVGVGGASQPAAMTSYLCAVYPAQYLSPHIPLALEEKLAALNTTWNIQSSGVCLECRI